MTEAWWRAGAPARVLALATLTTVAYLPCLLSDFTFDDIDAIKQNPTLFKTGLLRLFFTPSYFSISLEQSYRPLVTLSYLLDHALWALRPFGWHLENLALHLAIIFALRAILRQWLVPEKAATFAAAVFAVHPLHVEAVAGVGFREDLLCALFLLGMTFFHGRARIGTTRAWLACGLAGVCAFLAQMSKENGFVAPFLAVALLWSRPWQGPGALAGRDRARAAPFLAAVVAATALGVFFRFFWMTHSPEFTRRILAPTILGRALHAPWIFLANGFAPVFWPVELTPDRPVYAERVPAMTIFLGWCGIIVLGAVAAWVISKSRRSAFGLLWYIIAWGPTSNLPPLINPAAERYAYVPDLGLAMALAFAAAAAMARIGWEETEGFSVRAFRRGARALAVLLIIGLACRTFAQARLWNNQRTLWTFVLERNPSSLQAAIGLGVAEWAAFKDARTRGNAPLAAAEMRRAQEHFEAAIRIAPRNSVALSNYAIALSELERYLEAAEIFKKILEFMPNDRRANHNLGLLYLKMSPPDWGAALYHLERAREAGYPEDEFQLQKIRNAAGSRPSSGPVAKGFVPNVVGAPPSPEEPAPAKAGDERRTLGFRFFSSSPGGTKEGVIPDEPVKIRTKFLASAKLVALARGFRTREGRVAMQRGASSGAQPAKLSAAAGRSMVKHAPPEAWFSA